MEKTILGQEQIGVHAPFTEKKYCELENYKINCKKNEKSY